MALFKYTVQARNASGRWTTTRSHAHFNILTLAIDRCTACDEDKLFPAGVRIIDNETGRVVMDAKRWHALDGVRF